MDFSLAALEYYRLKDLVGRYISTEAGKFALDDLAPIADEQKLESEHAITAEAISYLREHRVPFQDIALLGQVLEKLSVEGVTLEIPEIEAIQVFVAQVEGLRVRWKEDREKFPKLAQTGQRLPDLRELGKHLGRAIQNGEVDDKYSPELARIRRALSAARSPSSGATVFMEPLAVLEMNNELVRLQDEERVEIARILAELTVLIQASTAQLQHACSLSAYIELVFAKARFARDFNCVSPAFSQGLLLSLINARHPLLEDNLRREKGCVAPVSLDMDTNRRILVISGPNAGGKTVVLKTVGLFALMAQSGIPVPAEEATLPVFDRILADIGDQQSITDHLSTFSAHVLAIKSMIESATVRSLVLLDEIGSSTEPGEGAALARAVLEKFREIGALAIATTHYNRLKVYAETTPDVANAAMEFNEITLEPTYRLIHGLAGASSGLKIAERLQLPRPVLESAIGYLDTADLEAAHYVEELKQRVTDLEHEKFRLEKERQDFEDWKRKELDQLTEQHKQEIARVEKKLEGIVREMSEKASRELESAGEESVKKYQKKLANVKAEAARELSREKEKIGPTSKLAPSPAALPARRRLPEAEGQRVRVVSLAVTGTIASIKDGEAEVLVGNIKLRRPVDDLEVIENVGPKLPQHVQLNITPKQLEKAEINVIGLKVDEALDIADKFLDDAFLAQVNPVRIVHGMGTGALRQAIADWLTKHPHVSRFESAPHSEGGRGVTIVTLRD